MGEFSRSSNVDRRVAEAQAGETLSETSVRKSEPRCPGRPPAKACLAAVLTQLDVADGNGRSPLDLAVEHGHRARVSSATDHTNAGSFTSIVKGRLGSEINFDSNHYACFRVVSG